MNTTVRAFTIPYYNTMEILVMEETQRQLQHLSPKVRAYISPNQAIAYALNRLPALYATSEEGVQRQRQRAFLELKSEIEIAVRQGLAAVQRDPLKVSTPLDLVREMETSGILSA